MKLLEWKSLNIAPMGAASFFAAALVREKDIADSGLET